MLLSGLRRWGRWLPALGLGLLALLACGAWAQDVLPVPALEGRRVIDETATLTSAEVAGLEDRLAALERETGAQLVVLMVPSTLPEDDFSYANRVANAWKLGRRDIGDGLLLLVAKNDRKVRIEVAKTLEGAIPDLRARQVIDTRITPAFRQGQFAAGLEAGVESLAALVRGENLPSPMARSGSQPGLQWEELGVFFIMGVPIFAMVLTGLFGRALGSLLTSGLAGGLAWWWTASLVTAGVAAVAALVLVGAFGFGSTRRGVRRSPGRGPVVLPGGGWGGGSGGSWGGGGGGGGFSSGGGGDFGGGGASGSW